MSHLLWTYIVLFLVASGRAQNILEGFSYDSASVDKLSDTCKAALDIALQCDSSLKAYESDNIQPTSEDLNYICTQECSDSLASAKKGIESACASECASDSILVVVGNQRYPITRTIDGLIGTKNRLCLRDVKTHEFCRDIMRGWGEIDGLTDEHLCSDYFLRISEFDVSSSSGSHLLHTGMSALDVLSNIAYCQRKGYEEFTPTSMLLNSTIHRAIVQRDMRSTTVCDPSAVYTVQQEDTCNGLCLARNISTHSLTASNFLHPYCRELPPAGTEICLLTSCDVYTVKKNDTLESIADQQPGRVSIERLLAWNPHLLPLWNLKKQTGMQICVSPPANTSSIPTDLAPSSFTHCGKYYEVQPGDTCADITSKEVISLPNLISLNPDIETDCVAGERYCVLSVPYIKKTSTLRGAATPAA